MKSGTGRSFRLRTQGLQIKWIAGGDAEAGRHKFAAKGMTSIHAEG
jgi:hypothetical protein